MRKRLKIAIYYPKKWVVTLRGRSLPASEFRFPNSGIPENRKLA
jgi:hypothetical protein